MNELYTKCDIALVECPLEEFIPFIEKLESHYTIQTIMEPQNNLVMVRAQDTIEEQQFYLGEALATECEVTVNNTLGIGLCLGEEPERAYGMAIVDAILDDATVLPPFVLDFINVQYDRSVVRDKKEFSQTLGTKVDFNLFNEEE